MIKVKINSLKTTNSSSEKETCRQTQNVPNVAKFVPQMSASRECDVAGESFSVTRMIVMMKVIMIVFRCGLTAHSSCLTSLAEELQVGLSRPHGWSERLVEHGRHALCTRCGAAVARAYPGFGDGVAHEHEPAALAALIGARVAHKRRLVRCPLPALIGAP